MKQEKLEHLLYSFIANRNAADTVDAVASGDIAVERGNPLPYMDAYNGNSFFMAQGQDPSGIIIGGAVGMFLADYHHAHAAPPPQVSATGRQLASLAAQFSMNYPHCSKIKFEKSCIIVAPEEQTILIKIIRSDSSLSKVTKVTWKTNDKTAISGIHYVGSSGEVVFDKDESEKSIQIKILESSDDAMDLRFIVELSDVDGGFDPNPMTVSLKKLGNFYPDERQVIRNFPISFPFTVEDIRSTLEDSLTDRTFHMALTHLCSAADSVHLEFALALDLSRLCLQHLRRESIIKVLKDFFRTEDID